MVSEEPLRDATLPGSEEDCAAAGCWRLGAVVAAAAEAWMGPAAVCLPIPTPISLLISPGEFLLLLSCCEAKGLSVSAQLRAESFLRLRCRASTTAPARRPAARAAPTAAPMMTPACRQQGSARMQPAPGQRTLLCPNQPLVQRGQEQEQAALHRAVDDPERRWWCLDCCRCSGATPPGTVQTQRQVGTTQVPLPGVHLTIVLWCVLCWWQLCFGTFAGTGSRVTLCASLSSSPWLAWHIHSCRHTYNILSETG